MVEKKSHPKRNRNGPHKQPVPETLGAGQPAGGGSSEPGSEYSAVVTSSHGRREPRSPRFFQRARQKAVQLSHVGLSLRDIASRVEVTVPTLRKWLRASLEAPASTQTRLRAALDLEAERVVVAVEGGEPGDAERQARAFTALAKAAQAYDDLEWSESNSDRPVVNRTGDGIGWEGADAHSLRQDLERRLFRIAHSGRTKPGPEPAESA